MGWKIREGTDGRNPWVSGTRIVTVAGMMVLASRNNRWSTCETWVEAARSKFRLVSVHLTWSLEISDNRSARSLSHVLGEESATIKRPRSAEFSTLCGTFQSTLSFLYGARPPTPSHACCYIGGAFLVSGAVASL